jgi:lysine-specific demethylase 8
MKCNGKVERIQAPSFEVFEREYRRPGKPVVITGATADWAATDRWNIDYLNDSFGDTRVVVDKIPDGKDPQLFDRRLTTQQEVELREYLATFEQPNAKLYLVALSIPENLPSLMADLGPLRWLSPKGRFDPMLFLAAAGSKTSLHSDFPDNLHVLIRGHKKVTLVDWRQSWRLYRDSVFTNRPNYSNVDIDAPDYERYPRFKGVNALEAEIRSGDTLYIPSFWWHRVHTVSTSIAVTHFWAGRKMCPPYFRIVVLGHVRAFVKAMCARLRK